MIDDRNMFRPVGGRADVVEMAAHLDAYSAAEIARLDDVDAQIALRLDRIERVIDALEGRRNVLAAQSFLLTPGPIDLVENGTRRDALDSFISAIETFMSKVPAIRARCLDASTPAATRLALAERFEAASVNVLQTAEGVSPLSDIAADVREMASGIVASAADLADKGLSTATVVAIAAAIVALVYLVKG
jgi:hypothetical protein